MKTFLASLTVLLLLALPGTAPAAGPVTVKGSDTMVILGQRWAEEFMKKNPAAQAAGDGRRLRARAWRRSSTAPPTSPCPAAP